MRAFTVTVYEVDDAGKLNAVFDVAYDQSRLTTDQAEELRPKISYVTSVLYQAARFCDGLLESQNDARVRKHRPRED